MAYVACGRFDGYWQRELNYWDIAAGIIILKEAGGFVDFFETDNDAPLKKNILASNSNIHDEFKDLIEGIASLQAPGNSYGDILATTLSIEVLGEDGVLGNGREASNQNAKEESYEFIDSANVTESIKDVIGLALVYITFVHDTHHNS